MTKFARLGQLTALCLLALVVAACVAPPGAPVPITATETPAGAPAETAPAEPPAATPEPAAPVDTEPVAESPAGGLAGTRWTLMVYTDAQGQMAGIAADSEATLEFRNGQITGNASCNTYNGTYVEADEQLTIEVGARTLMACAEPLMAQEDAFLAALGQAASHRVTGAKLDILNAEGAVVLTFVAATPLPAAPPVALTGTEWQVTEYNNGRGAVVSILAGTTVTLTFGVDGELGGVAGCNSYGAPYKLDGNQLTIDPVFSTMMICMEPEGILDQEADYLAALMSATAYELSGDGLTLTTATGERVLSATATGAGPTTEASGVAEAPAVAEAPVATEVPVATEAPIATEVPAATEAPPTTTPVPAAPAPVTTDATLSGTVWLWQQTAMADGSIVTVKAPERYSARFLDDGIVVVQADCNRASGIYSINGEELMIRVGAVTRAACPSGSLSLKFIESLNAAGTFLFDGENLVINQQADGGDMLFTGTK